MKKAFTITVFLFCSIFMLHAEEFKQEDGHSATVSAIAMDSSAELLFSCDYEGILTVRNIHDGSLVKKIKISGYSISKIALSKDSSLLAVNETDNSGYNRISVWNWTRETQIFSVKIDGKPLSLAFSPSDRWVICSTDDLQSLTFINSNSGEILPYLKKSWGIITRFLVNPQETIIQTYSNSGTLSYIDIQTGEIKRSLKLQEDLEKVSFANGGIYLTAVSGNDLVCFDRRSGTVTARTPIKETIIAMENGENSKALVLLKNQNGKIILANWDYTTGVVTKTNDFEISSSITSTIFYLNNYFIGMSDGSLYLFSLNSNPVRLTKPLPELYTGISAAEESIYLINQDFLFKVKINKETNSMDESSTWYVQNPLKAPSAILPLKNKQFIVYTIAGNTGKIMLFNSESGEWKEAASSPLPYSRIIQCSDGKIASIDSIGRFCVYDPENQFKVVFSFSFPGADNITAADNDRIAASSSYDSGIGSSLIFINIRTGEIAPVTVNSRRTMAMFFGQESGLLYTAAVDESTGKAETVFRAHAGATFDFITPLKTFEGALRVSDLIYNQASGLCAAAAGGKVLLFSEDNYSEIEHIQSALKLVSLDASIAIMNSNGEIKIIRTIDGEINSSFVIKKDNDGFKLINNTETKIPKK